LSEGSHVTCPRCNGTGHIRDTESSALQVLRIIQEEAMKENSAAIHVQAPVDVAAFLLNEKRGEILKIETRHRVTIILIPNKHLETPHYKLERIKHDDPRLDDSQASYAMAEQAETDISYAKRQKEEVKSRQEAVVKGITPDQPAPIVERKAEVQVAVVAPAVTASKPGFFGWLKSLFGSSAAEPVAAPAPVVEEKPAAQRDRNDRNARGQRNRNRGGRNGRDREDRNEERATGNRNAQREETAKTTEAAPANARTQKPQREPREAREPREPREPREDNRQENRQRNERPARPAREERKEQVAEVKAEEALPVTAVVDTSAEGAAISGVEATERETGEQKERRRRRRGGRNRNRRDRDGENAQSADGSVDEGGDDAGEGSVLEAAHAAPITPAQPELAFDAPSAPAVPAVPVHNAPVETPAAAIVAHEEAAPIVETPVPSPSVVEAPVVHTPEPAVVAPAATDTTLVVEVAAPVEPVAVAAPAVVVAAPVTTEVKATAPAPAPAPAPIVAPAPKVDLSQVLATAGLVQASTDPIKLRAAQEAAAQIVPKQHVPRERKPAPVMTTEPLVQVHTRH
jgi:ribonuclease E